MAWFEEVFFALPLFAEYDEEGFFADDEEPFDAEELLVDDVFFDEDEALFAEPLDFAPEYAVLDEEPLLC